MPSPILMSSLDHTFMTKLPNFLKIALSTDFTVSIYDDKNVKFHEFSINIQTLLSIQISLQNKIYRARFCRGLSFTHWVKKSVTIFDQSFHGSFFNLTCLDHPKTTNLRFRENGFRSFSAFPKLKDTN